MKTKARRLLTGLAALAIIAGSFAIASPAQAYGTLTQQYARIHLANCARQAGTVAVYGYDDRCIAGGASFKKNGSSAQGLVVYWVNSSGFKLIQVEFHPYGDHLIVRDYKDDGDTMYARIRAGSGDWRGPYSADSSGSTDVNFNFGEGTEIDIEIFDDKAMTDYVGGGANIAVS